MKHTVIFKITLDITYLKNFLNQGKKYLKEISEMKITDDMVIRYQLKYVFYSIKKNDQN